jgi:DNA-binding SARP family transcriptional activator
MLPSFILATFVTRWGNGQSVIRQYLQLDHATINNWQLQKELHLQQNLTVAKSYQEINRKETLRTQNCNTT